MGLAILAMPQRHTDPKGTNLPPMHGMAIHASWGESGGTLKELIK